VTLHRDVVAVGASAGGVEALRALVAGLPPDYPGALLVVLHVPRDGPSALPAILDRSGPLPAATATDGETLRPGRIYVAPNDHHLLVLDGRLRLTRGPAENGHRPAIDPLFRSVARAYGRRAIGVVLSGSRDDGAAGLATIAARGGAAVVQDPADALYPWMPRAAIAHMQTDTIAAAAKLGGLIAGITAMELSDTPPPADDSLLDAELAISELAPVTTDHLAVSAAGYGCPACGGSLFQIDDRPVPRYRLPGGSRLVTGEPAGGAGHCARGGAVDGVAGAGGEVRAEPPDGTEPPPTACGQRRPVPGHGRRRRGRRRDDSTPDRAAGLHGAGWRRRRSGSRGAIASRPEPRVPVRCRWNPVIPTSRRC
jgi:two-component system, chemotaxis family, protein-glutamate methylesterase/glutaminase